MIDPLSPLSGVLPRLALAVSLCAVLWLVVLWGLR
jgi:hypothetical protein